MSVIPVYIAFRYVSYMFVSYTLVMKFMHNDMRFKYLVQSNRAELPNVTLIILRCF